MYENGFLYRLAFVLMFCAMVTGVSPACLAQRFTAELIAAAGGSQVSGDQLGGFDKGGFAGGLGVRTRFKEHWSLGFRMMYIQKGSRKPSKLDQGDPSFYLMRLNYIEVPLMLRYTSTKKFFLEAGPGLGYLLSSYEEDENGEMPFRTPFLDFDLCFNVAAGYPITRKLDFIFTYQQSVVPVREAGSGTAVGTSYFQVNSGQYNSVILFGLLYRLEKKKEKTED